MVLKFPEKNPGKSVRDHTHIHFLLYVNMQVSDTILYVKSVKKEPYTLESPDTPEAIRERGEIFHFRWLVTQGLSRQQTRFNDPTQSLDKTNSFEKKSEVLHIYSEYSSNVYYNLSQGLQTICVCLFQ